MDAVIAEAIRQDLICEMAAMGAPAHSWEPTHFNIYVASSGLQKAIRRGDIETAFNCAARLLSDDEGRFWRRLVTIAFEDIGIGDVDLVARVIAVAGNRAWRSKHGGERTIASHLVSRMCVAAKDRTADDLISFCELDPILSYHRCNWQTTAVEALVEAIHPSQTLEELALAAWYAIGTNRERSEVLPLRYGDPNAVWRRYLQLGIDDRVVTIAKLGHCRGGYILAPFFPLIWLKSRGTGQSVRTEVLRRARSIRGLPGYVFDGHTRTGKCALRLLPSLSYPWRSFLEKNVPKANWAKVSHFTLFNAESGLVNRRLSWADGDRIRVESKRLVQTISPELALEALGIMTAELSMMDEARETAIVVEESNLG